MPENGEDRRGESRRNLNLQVEYPDRQGYRIDVTESVSNRGIFIRSTQHHRVGERVRLAVSLPGFPDSIQLTGVVARIREATAEKARGVGLYIAQEEYIAKLGEVMSSSEGQEFSLSSGPYSVLAALPRVRLATTPTPLHRADRLSKALGGPDIWFKRDDLTGFALGGNKVRKMELTAALALEQGADTLVIGAHSVSSHRIRITAAAAARLGLDAVAVVANTHSEPSELAFSKFLGTEIRGLLDEKASIDDNVSLCVAELKAAGKKPFGLTENDASYAACGYILASIELITQLRRQHLSPEVLVCPVGSAETMSGLVVAQRWLDCSYDVHGVSVARSLQWCTERVATIASDVCHKLNIADTIPVDDIWINAEYAHRDNPAGKQSQAESTAKAMAAVRKVAQLEGIFLDPVFTGRAMAGLFDLIASGELGKRHSVVFLHTGGSPTGSLPGIR